MSKAVLLGAVLLASTAFADSPPALSADEIVSRYIQARGGLEKIKALQSLHRTGRLSFPGANINITCSELRKRPGKLRSESTYQGLTAVEAYDGKEAWRIQPFQGRKDPERISADETKALALESDIDGPLVDYKAKGHKLELLGTEDLDGTPAYKLRLTLKTGDEIITYVDPDTFMVLREIQRRIVRGTEEFHEVDYGDYEKVAGVYVPMTIEEGDKGSPSTEKVKTIYEKAEANVAADDKAFSFPAH